MKRVKAKAKRGLALVKVYEDIEEAIKDVGKERVLHLINKSVRTNAINEVNAVKKPQAIRNKKTKDLEAKSKAGTLSEKEVVAYTKLLAYEASLNKL